jgi:hypothetical protein
MSSTMTKEDRHDTTRADGQRWSRCLSSTLVLWPPGSIRNDFCTPEGEPKAQL